MIALNITDVSLDDRLRELRQEVRDLEIKNAAERGEGWEIDVLAAQPKPRTLAEDDVQAAIEGRPLSSPKTVETDTKRLLAAKRAAVKRLAAEHYARQMRSIQADHDVTAGELQALVTTAAKVLKTLPAMGQAAERVLRDLERFEAARASLRVESDGVALPPLERADGAHVEVARVLVKIGELAEAAEKVLQGRRAA